MSDPKISANGGADWTQLLTDPDLVGHLGELLQAYRDAAPEKRDQILMEALRQIKKKRSAATAQPAGTAASPASAPVATTPADTPPFEPDIFTASSGEDRRRHPRMKCFVAVELRVENVATPVWGNLSNTSLGGCFVETASAVQPGLKVEIGLWLASGKVWVKGLILNGIVTQSKPCFGVRVRFADMEPNGRESFRQFLKFVETTTRGYADQHGYLAQLKR